MSDDVGMMGRLAHPPEGYVRDRWGHVWALVRDGGMVTRADYAGVVTMGVAVAEATVGPLLPLDAPLWLVTSVGVYDHGVYLIARSLEEAQKFCEQHSVDTDGYHSWRIDEMPVGVPRETHDRAEVVAEWDRRELGRVGRGYGSPRPCPAPEVDVERWTG